MLVVAACSSSSESKAPRAISVVRAELLGYVEDVKAATGYRYRATDDHGHTMDTAKIIETGETGELAAVYHWWDESINGFRVSLATSSNLLDWKWRVNLGDHVSQPTIKAASDGGYVVAYDSDIGLHLKFAYFRTWDDLLHAKAAKAFDAERQLPGCAEGTANLYTASSTRVEFGLHFFAGCESDRQARGTTDWTSWTASEQLLLNRAALLQGYHGSIGDRDVINFEGHEFTFLEAQFVQSDWRTFRVLLYDEGTGAADRASFPNPSPLPPSVHVLIRTHAGSYAFTNLTVSEVHIDGHSALVVGVFIPSEGAQGDEAGELIYYRLLDKSDEVPRPA